MKPLKLRFEVPAGRVDAIRTSLLRLGATEASMEDRYFDTADRRLARGGLALRLRAWNGRWEQTLKAASNGTLRRRRDTVSREDVSGTELCDPRPEIRARGDIQPALRRALGADAAAHALQLVHSSVLKRWLVAVDADTSRIAMSLDVGSIVAGPSFAATATLTYELKKGDRQALFAFARSGVLVHGLWLQTESLERRGERLSRGGGVQSPTVAVATALRKSQDGTEIFRAVVRSCMAQVVPNAGAVAAKCADDEVIHQLRVGLRRMRTATCDLSHLRTRPWSRGVDMACGRIFRALGDLRDRSAVTEVLARLGVVTTPSTPSRRQSDGGRALTALVRGADFQCAMLDMLEVASCKHPQAHAALHVACRSSVGPHKARRLIDARLERLHRRLCHDAQDFVELDASARHGVRKRLKRLRYLAEHVSSLRTSRGEAICFPP